MSKALDCRIMRGKSYSFTSRARKATEKRRKKKACGRACHGEETHEITSLLNLETRTVVKIVGEGYFIECDSYVELRLHYVMNMFFFLIC